MTGDVPEVAQRLAALFAEQGKVRTHEMPAGGDGRSHRALSSYKPPGSRNARKRGPTPHRQRPQR